MSDPNQPYGAVPPPSFPPPPGPPQGPPPGFPPPGGGPSGPPPGGPWGPPPPVGGKGRGNGLWIALAVVGVLALVGVVIGLVLVLTDGDDDSEKGDDDTTSSGPAPDEVVESLIDAAEGGDCDMAKTFLTEDARAADPCNSAEFRLLSTDDVDAEVGDPVIDGDEATVPVGFDNQGTTEDYVFNLEQVDGTWLVASYAIDSGGTDGTGVPTDDATSSTDAPTDGPTDGPTSPGGTSTADSVANDPEAVVEAFMVAFVNGDCATAEDLVTESYIKDEGNCDPAEITPFSSQLKYSVGAADVDEAAGTATVPVDITVAGQSDRGTFTLVEENGRWRINGSDDMAG